jgi:transposase
MLDVAKSLPEDLDALTQFTAPLPSRPIERGRPGPGLVSHMLVGKYCDHRVS